jgi:hypothetical protein
MIACPDPGQPTLRVRGLAVPFLLAEHILTPLWTGRRAGGYPGASRQPHNEPVLEPRLFGYWTDKYLYPGDMESADIAFRSDGTGWVYWCNAASAFQILRFTWRTASGKHLSISVDEQVSGTWHLDGLRVSHLVHDRTHSDDQIALTFTIAAGHDDAGKPTMLLEFDQPPIRGVTGDRFTLERELADNESDPARDAAEFHINHDPGGL